MNIVPPAIKPKEGFLFLMDNYDIGPLKTYVSKLTEDDWLKDSVRQKIYAAHKSTCSIKVQWIPLNVTFFDKNQIEYNEFLYSDVTAILKDLLDFLCEYYNGEVYKILLARLNPQSEISLHRDNGFSLLHTHRVHIPVQTNDLVAFGCSGQEINMKEGQVVEIDNSNLHYVKNNSDQYRIHLIVDIIEKTRT